ncbi:MAG: T9SS type A sorting domain-containing protein [Bacteroidota bacterium]|nr:T9SS type A sorting domain-containing protein [Bacteroidota bacterium]
MRKLSLIVFLFFGIFLRAQSTFNDIAPILYKNCTSCHRPGGGAPFSMLSYASTSPWTTSMLHVLQHSEMPPWAADTSYIHFVNERQITKEDKDSLLTWIFDGSLEGDPALQPPTPLYPLRQLGGTPDTVIQMLKFKSNAGSTDSYNTIAVPLNLGQNRFLRAVELIPSNPQLIHHSLIVADFSGGITIDTSGNAYAVPGNIAIGTWAPGSMPIVYPNSPEIKMGIELPANGEIGMNIHTPKGTAGQLVDIQVRLYFYPLNETGIRQVFDFVPLQYWDNDFIIPAGQIKSFSVQEPAPSQSISIFSAFPHSHQICTEIINYAYNPQTKDTIPLMKIDRWDFEHQEYYYYKNLVKLSPPFILYSEHTYDNTSLNHHNPYSPPRLIRAGFNTDDEMLYDGFQYIRYQTGDENFNIDSILKNDPLIVLGIPEETIKRGITSVVMPNPVQNYGTILMHSKSNEIENSSFHVYNQQGQKVDLNYRFEEGNIQFSKAKLSAGMYFYEVVNQGNRITSGRIIFE